MKNETLTAILNEKDKLSAYMGVGVDYYKGETGKSGADEVYIGPEPPTDPEVKLWVDTEDQSLDVVNWDDVENKPNFATVATSGSYEDLTNKPTIPEPYTLPTASTDTLGGVKVDGETITIADGVISSSAGGDLIGKKMKGYRQPESEWTWMADWAQHPEKYYVVIEGVYDTNEEGPVIRTYVSNNSFYYYWFEDDTLHRGYINFTDNTLSQVESVNEWPDAGTVWLTEKNRWAYIPEPDLTPYAKTADLSTVATSGSYEDLKNKPNLFSGDYQDLTNKPTIPDAYTLPTASTDTLGGVKVIHNSVLSSDDDNKVLMDDNNQLFIPYASTRGRGSVGLVGFDPNYFDIDSSLRQLSPKKATIANLGVVKPDGTTITIDNDGVISAAGSSGSSDTRFIVINKGVSDTLTDEEGALLYKVATNLGKYSLTFIDNSNHQYNNCIRIYKDNSSSSRYYFVFYNTTDNNTSNNRIMRYYGSPIDKKIKKLSYDWQYDTTLLDTNNWNSYISVPSDWNYTADISDSNLYNAKEIAIYWEYNNIYHCNYYNFSSNSYLGYFNGYTFCAMNDYTNGNSTWDYNGSNINTNNMNIQTIYYKT